VATRPSSRGGRASEARLGVETTPRPQTDEDLARTPLQPLHRIVASVENEQGSDPLLRRPPEKRFHLLGGHLVGVLGGADTLHVHGGGPALADGVEPGDELVGPSGYDGLTGGVAGRMVVETALGAALRVAAGPHAHIHSVDGIFVPAPGERVVGEQSSQDLGIDLPRFNAA
jgi:hypothetical protein